MTSNARDASSIVIIASALFEPDNFSKSGKEEYHEAAIQMLYVFSGPRYRNKPGENANFILKHSVGSIPHKVEIDVPLVYADYYYLEALLRYKKIIQPN